ncbi:MAG: hypothetical protein A2792_13560 [Sphingomonadales bacterium RIFCSPHIGHO2_01_FULL_65_20]|nr:MAG: hypothetical protein A2792_13560 [Sphingomonadales bacterium RIFCSPHIGHO2_01_FULL_65_20]
MTADSDPDLVLLDHPAAGVVRLRLNRPEKRNAIDQATRQALMSAADGAFGDPRHRAVVFGGMGGVFSAGGDLPSMAGLTEVQARDRLNHGHTLCRLFAGSPAPIVSAVEGVAAGASVGLALLGDYIVVGRSSRILFPFIKLGLVPDWGLLRSLPMRVGLSRARRIILSGASIDGPTAVDIGLADEVVDDEAVAKTAVQRAQTYAALPREASRRIRARLGAFGDLDLDGDLVVEVEDQTACLLHPEFREGLAAQMERRAPDFIGLGAPETAT